MKLNLRWIGLCLLLTGCNQQPTQTQILATVNGREISSHQLNFAIAQNASGVTGQTEREELIEKLILRELAVQQALALGLDRQPDVMMRLEETRLDLLAFAYAGYVIRQNPQMVADDAVARYWLEHPALFSQRKVYTLREISIPSDLLALTEAMERLERLQDLDTFIDWLKQQPGSFGDQVATRAAEHLPVEVADRLLPPKPNETISFKLPRALIVYQMQSAVLAPVDLQTARPVIERYLRAQSENSLYEQELERLREQAQVSLSSQSISY